MQKIVKLNRAFLYCCMVVTFCLYFKGYAAPTQGKPVSLTIKNSTLAQVLREVSKKSGLYIYFQDTDLAAHKNVTIDVRDKPVESVLHELLDRRGFSWVEVGENTIAVKKKPIIEERVEGDTIATITVTGKVVDERGAPVIGATVKTKIGNKGSITNALGDFTLNDVKPNAQLIVSNLGFLTKEVSINKRSSLGSILLQGFVNTLDETQIIAYGETSRRTSTGNISTVKRKDIEKQPVNNPLLALQGRIPGISVEQSTGLPGSTIKVRIQGQNSISNGNAPLYVIDGVPYASQLLPSIGSSLGGDGNPLSFINPLDIESIDVLKDADATSIYGSRAANGAILISTKKGSVGKTRVDLNVRNGWGKVTRKLNLLNTQQYIDMRETAFKNDNASPTATDYDVNGIWNKNAYTDWQRELIGGTSHYSDISIDLSGGASNTAFLVGGTFHKETSVMPSDYSDEKSSLHFNVNSTSNDKAFKFTLSGSYLFDDNQLPGTPDFTNTAITLPPNAPVLRNADESINWAPILSNNSLTSTWNNPLALLEKTFSSKVNNLIGNSVLSYKILPELELKANLGYTFLQSKELQMSPSTLVAPEQRPFFNRTSQFGYNTISSWIIEPQLLYKKPFNIGNIEVLVGTTFQNSSADGLRLDAKGFNSDLVLGDINSATTVTPFLGGGTTIYTYRYNAVFGRITYNLYERYFINMSARRDGSSRFGAKNRFHNFGSLGAAWIFSNEAFMKGQFSFLSFGKLKASFGTTGNDQIGDYQFLSLYTPTIVDVPYQGAGGLQITGLPNPYLQWEETRKLSIGLDLGFIRDRVLLNINYNKNLSSNQLVSIPLANSTGFNSIVSNLPATVQNTGWEISLSTINIKSNSFNWNSNFNITVPRNKLKHFPDLATSAYADMLVEGRSIDITKVYHYVGVNPETGLYEFATAHGTPVSQPDFFNDRTTFLVGMNTPEYYGGLNNSFQYKGFELDLLFSFVKQKGMSYAYGTAAAGVMQNQPTYVLDAWRKKGDISTIQRYVSLADFNNYFPTFYLTQSDAMYSDASYIRLKNLSFSYQIPTYIMSRAHMQSAKIYLQAQNLLTISSYKGLDPENRSSSLLPPLRVITAGIQISL